LSLTPQLSGLSPAEIHRDHLGKYSITQYKITHYDESQALKTEACGEYF
jgi:hypothetical protein